MSDEEYIYAVARIRSKELSLFNKADLDQLMASKNYEECLRILGDKGWGNPGDDKAEQVLVSEREKTWNLISELVEEMSVFDTFLYEKDFHNLKAAIKQVYLNVEVPNIYINNGTIDPKVILNRIEKHDFSLLPEHMIQSAQEAYEVLMHTGDGQLCDIILDKAALDTIYHKSKESKNDLLLEYAEIKVAASDINIALRGCKTKKGMEFYQRALAACDSLDIKKLAEAAISGLDAIYDFLEATVYADAIPNIKESSSAFERWCDDLIMKHIKPQKYNPFSVSPLAAYILARENEIKSVRIILSGKRNDLAEESVRERLRDMYV